MHDMNKYSLGIIGASGYSGIELCRILAGHPGATVRFVTSDRWAGQAVQARTGISGPIGALRYFSPEEGLESAADCDVVFLATPAEASLEMAPQLLSAGCRVVDLSGAFRLSDASQYPAFYKLTHAHPGLLAEAVYALPELTDRKRIAQARLTSNPGCYPTAAALSIAPLVAAKLVDPESIVISAASGVSGAGRKASEDYSFSEISEDFRPYKALRHQHTPEIEQTLSRVAGEAIKVAFTPHLLPIKRGIICTTFARLRSKVGASELSAVLADAYGK
jgi:N-acetyl-gamma-glutamyl-phosphate reductase